jgi:hypothetical protein
MDLQPTVPVRVGSEVSEGHFGHRRDLAGQGVLQALNVIPAVIAVLVEDGDLAVWFMLEQVFGLNLTFCLVA